MRRGHPGKLRAKMGCVSISNDFPHGGPRAHGPCGQNERAAPRLAAQSCGVSLAVGACHGPTARGIAPPESPLDIEPCGSRRVFGRCAAPFASVRLRHHLPLKASERNLQCASYTTTVVCLLGLESISRAAVPPNACNAIECRMRARVYVPGYSPQFNLAGRWLVQRDRTVPIPTGASCVGRCRLTQNSCFLSIKCGDTCTRTGTDCFNSSVCCAPVALRACATEGVSATSRTAAALLLAVRSPVGTASAARKQDEVPCTHRSCRRVPAQR